jgi:hypothetical protein
LVSDPVQVNAVPSRACRVNDTVAPRYVPVTVTLPMFGETVPDPVTLPFDSARVMARFSVLPTPTQRPVREGVGPSASVTGTLTRAVPEPMADTTIVPA